MKADFANNAVGGLQLSVPPRIVGAGAGAAEYGECMVTISIGRSTASSLAKISGSIAAN
jgi:hypothetical protein